MTGHLRDHAFVQPLRAGYNLLSASTPIDASPAWRGFTGQAFRGHTDPTLADGVQLWAGDRQVGEEAYESYFLLDGDLRYWAHQEDVNLNNVDESALFPGNRAFFLELHGDPQPSYRIPAARIQRER